MSINGIEFRTGTQVGGLERIQQQRETALERAGGSGETGGAEGSKTFGDFMKDLVQDANRSALEADGKMQDVAAGRNKDLHGAVLAMEKADVQFRLLTQVRNKVIDAYREILKMQV